MNYRELELPINKRYKPVVIREIQAPHLNIWPFQTFSFECSDDGKGRSVQIMTDIIEKKVVGKYYGGSRNNHYLISTLHEDTKKELEKIIFNNI